MNGSARGWSVPQATFPKGVPNRHEGTSRMAIQENPSILSIPDGQRRLPVLVNRAQDKPTFPVPDRPCREMMSDFAGVHRTAFCIPINQPFKKFVCPRSIPGGSRFSTVAVVGPSCPCRARPFLWNEISGCIVAGRFRLLALQKNFYRCCGITN